MAGSLTSIRDSSIPLSGSPRRHVTTGSTPRRRDAQCSIRDKPRSLCTAADAGTFDGCVRQDGERSGMLPAGDPATVTGQFRPLDPDIVNEAIPAFFIGRNKEGFWVARDAKGQIGGIFLLENSALSFARRHSRAGRVRDHISLPAVRTRPGKQRQSAGRAAWIVDAPSAPRGRLRRQGDRRAQTPAGRFSRPLNRGGGIARPANNPE